MGNKNGIYLYFIEGKLGEKIINTLKKENLILPGKISTFNLLENQITNSRIRSISNGTTIFIVFNTDIQSQKKINQLNKNIEILSKLKEVKNIILVPQNKNLEEELINSTTVSSLKELLDNQPNTDFERELERCSNFFQNLKLKKFDINIFWRRPLNPNCKFEQYINNLVSLKVKRYK